MHEAPNLQDPVFIKYCTLVQNRRKKRTQLIWNRILATVKSGFMIKPKIPSHVKHIRLSIMSPDNRLNSAENVHTTNEKSRKMSQCSICYTKHNASEATNAMILGTLTTLTMYKTLKQEFIYQVQTSCIYRAN